MDTILVLISAVFGHTLDVIKFEHGHEHCLVVVAPVKGIKSFVDNIIPQRCGCLLNGLLILESLRASSVALLSVDSSEVEVSVSFELQISGTSARLYKALCARR